MPSHLSTLHPVSLQSPSLALRRVGDCLLILRRRCQGFTLNLLTRWLHSGLNSGPVPNAAPPPAGPVPEVQQRAFSQPPPTGKSVRFNQSSPSSLSGSKPYNKTPTGHHPRGVPVHDPMGTTSAPSVNDRHRPHPQRRRRASDNDINRIPSPTSSDETIDLPDRFDKYGRRKPEKGDDPLADQLEEFLNGNGLAGRFLDRLTGALEGVDGDSGRRRHRRT